jgi:hypothetical protein
MQIILNGMNTVTISFEFDMCVLRLFHVKVFYMDGLLYCQPLCNHSQKNIGVKHFDLFTTLKSGALELISNCI